MDQHAVADLAVGAFRDARRHSAARRCSTACKIDSSRCRRSVRPMLLRSGPTVTGRGRRCLMAICSKRRASDEKKDARPRVPRRRGLRGRFSQASRSFAAGRSFSGTWRFALVPIKPRIASWRKWRLFVIGKCDEFIRLIGQAEHRERAHRNREFRIAKHVQQRRCARFGFG